MFMLSKIFALAAIVRVSTTAKPVVIAKVIIITKNHAKSNCPIIRSKRASIALALVVMQKMIAVMMIAIAVVTAVVKIALVATSDGF